MSSGKSPHTKRLQASTSSELWCCCMEATERSLHVATRMGWEPLTSKGDARQGVRVSQVVGSLQKTTQHGWKRWQTLKNIWNGTIKDKWWPGFLLKNVSRLISWWGGGLHPKKKLKSSYPGNDSGSVYDGSALIYLLKAKSLSPWPERIRVGAKEQVCREQTHTSHPEEISTFPVLLSSPVSWLFPRSAHIFASLFGIPFVP